MVLVESQTLTDASADVPQICIFVACGPCIKAADRRRTTLFAVVAPLPSLDDNDMRWLLCVALFCLLGLGRGQFGMDNLRKANQDLFSPDVITVGRDSNRWTMMVDRCKDAPKCVELQPQHFREYIEDWDDNIPPVWFNMLHGERGVPLFYAPSNVSVKDGQLKAKFPVAAIPESESDPNRVLIQSEFKFTYTLF